MKHCETILICAVQLIHIMYLKCLVIAIVSLQGVLQYFTDVKYDWLFTWIMCSYWDIIWLINYIYTEKHQVSGMNRPLTKQEGNSRVDYLMLRSLFLSSTLCPSLPPSPTPRSAGRDCADQSRHRTIRRPTHPAKRSVLRCKQKKNATNQGACEEEQLL